MTKRGLSLPDRIKICSELEPETGCWLWKGKLNPYGYATMTVTSEIGKITVKAHRLSYQQFNGLIP